METQQELMQAYWGPGGTVDIVRAYNDKHGSDVKPWECVKCEGAFKKHPEFTARPEAYNFFLTILYDDKRNEHRPVFVGDKVYDKKIPQELEVIDSDTLQYGVLRFTDLDWDKISWNQPKPKRTFKVELNNDEFVYLQQITILADSSLNRSIHAALTAARDKE